MPGCVCSIAERILSRSGSLIDLFVRPIVRRVLEELPEFFLIDGLVVRFFRRNAGVAKMIHDRVVERLVALLFADLNHAGDLVRLGFAHEVGDRHVDHQNFQGGDAAWFVDSFEKILRDDALERFRERGANLVLLISRENVDDTIDGFGGA